MTLSLIPLQQRLIDEIRAIDPGRTIIVNFGIYSLPHSFTNQIPFVGSNLIYTVHMYEPHEYTHQGLEGLPTPVSYTVGSLEAYLAPTRAFQLANNVPIYCGEFSVNRIAPGRLQYLTEVTGLLESYNWSWTYHAWREYSGWDSEMNSNPVDFTRRPTEPTYQLLSGLMSGASTTPVAGFGSGSAAGTYASDVWTPGVDSQGVVNQASWNITPVGQWFKVAGSRMDILDSAVKAAIPAWVGYGGAGPNGDSWDGIFVSWSTFCQDKVGGRHWIFGGGHTNSFNNGLYRFDLFKMKWDIECLPTDPAVVQDTAYFSSGSSTGYGPSVNLFNAKRSAGTLSTVNDVYYDELEDGKPTARHVYSGMAYSASLNKIIMMCRRLWTYNLQTRQWDYKRLVNDYVTTGSVTGDEAFGAEGVRMAWDETRQRLWALCAASSGNRSTFAFNFNEVDSSGRQGKWYANAYLPWYGALEQAVCLKDDNTYVAIKTPSNPSRPYSGRGEYTEFDLATGTDKPGFRNLDNSEIQPQLGGGLQFTDFNGDDDNMSVVWIPSINRYWMWLKFATAPVYRCVELDPTTTPWTMSIKNFTGYAPDVGEGNSGLLGQKVLYYPQLNCLILQYAASREMSIYRLPA